MNRSASLILAAGLVAGLAALGFLLADAAMTVKSLERTVTVKGLSEREVTADIAVWPVTFQVAANDLDEAYQAVDDKTAVVRAFLLDHGLASDEIAVAPPNIADLYAQQWGDKSNIRFRYVGSATLTVYSTKVDAVRAAMAATVELGKRGVAVAGDTGPGQAPGRFLFTGLNALKPAMIEEATKNARAVAEKFAKDSDSRLGKIRTARQGQFSITDRDATTPHLKKVRVVSTVEYYLAD